MFFGLLLIQLRQKYHFFFFLQISAVVPLKTTPGANLVKFRSNFVKYCVFETVNSMLVLVLLFYTNTISSWSLKENICAKS